MSDQNQNQQTGAQAQATPEATTRAWEGYHPSEDNRTPADRAKELWAKRNPKSAAGQQAVENFFTLQRAKGNL